MWKRSLALLLLLLLLSVPIFSEEICLTESEMWELETLLTELEKLLEEQAIQLELAETQLNIALQEIVKLEVSLKLVETSWREQEREHTKETIAWVVVSLLAGGFLGVVLE